MITPLTLPVSRLHVLKVWPEFYLELESGAKTFEVRKNDRGFSVGDTLILKEWNPETGYTGRSTRRAVSYVLAGPAFGVEAGFVCMALLRALPSVEGNQQTTNEEDLARVHDQHRVTHSPTASNNEVE